MEEDENMEEENEKKMENMKIEGRLGHHVHEDVEEIKEFLRHIHNDVENARRDLAIIMHKIDGVAFLHEVLRYDVEKAVNISDTDINLDEIYSPIDIKDKEKWEKHLESEKNRKNATRNGRNKKQEKGN